MSGIAELRASLDMLRRVRERVAAGIGQGWSLEQIREGRPTADLDERWETGFLKADVFVGLVHRSLSEAAVDPE